MVTLHDQKPRAKKVRYIEYDIDEINHIIYNDLPTPLIEEDIKQKWYADKLLYKNEIGKLLPNCYSGYHFITNWGRVLNAKQVKELKIQNIADKFFAFYVDGGRVKLEEAMEEVGFIYDYDKIKAKYKELNIETRWVKG